MGNLPQPSAVGLPSGCHPNLHNVLVVCINSSANRADNIRWNSTTHRTFTTQRPEMHKRSDVRSLVSPGRCAALPSSFLQSLQPQAWCRCHLFSLTTLSIIMVCKAVLTFLVFGALSVNVSAIPVPERAPIEGFAVGGGWNKISPTSTPDGRSSTLNPSSDNYHRDDSPAPTPPPKDHAPTPPPKDDAPVQDAPAKNSSGPKPGLGSKILSSVGKMGEFPRLFSALSDFRLLRSSGGYTGDGSLYVQRLRYPPDPRPWRIQI